MTELDTALYLLQNKTRRLIVERLVREPHYAMQLAELIGVSQPAVVKHLGELESGGLVPSKRSHPTKEGPPRTIYSVDRAFSLHIDLGPDLFDANAKVAKRWPYALISKITTGFPVNC